MSLSQPRLQISLSFSKNLTTISQIRRQRATLLPPTSRLSENKTLIQPKRTFFWRKKKEEKQETTPEQKKPAEEEKKEEVAADASSKEGTTQEPSQESKGKSPYIVTEKVGNVDITFVLPKEHPEWYDPKAERLKLVRNRTTISFIDLLPFFFLLEERYITSRFYQSHKIPTATYFPTVPFILRGVHQKYRTVPWERRNSEDRGKPRPMLIFKF